MKFSKLFGAILTAALITTICASAAADEPYSYLAGKADHTGPSLPYAGILYEGGEQGNTSDYSFKLAQIGKPWNTAK